MSSSTNSSDKKRIWELEEQLEDEQHAHRKTKFTLRDAQEKLEQKRIGMISITPKNEALEAENEDLKKALKQLEKAHSTLEKSNQENKRLIATLNDELVKMKSQGSNGNFQKEIHDLVEVNKGLIGSLNWEKGEWKIQMEQQSEKIVVFEKTIRDLQQEYTDLHISATEAMNAMESERDYETMLKEHWKEVSRLRVTKRGAVERCQHWASECEQMIGRLIAFLEDRALEDDAEEIKKLREDRKKACADYDWCSDYKYVTNTLSDVFEAIQEMRSTPDSKGWLVFNRGKIIESKELFDVYSRKVKKGKEGKEWVEEELESEGFEIWGNLIREAEERINEES